MIKHFRSNCFSKRVVHLFPQRLPFGLIAYGVPRDEPFVPFPRQRAGLLRSEAGILSFMLAPLVRMLQHLRLPRGLAVVSVVLLAFAAIFALGTVMARQVTQLAGDLPRYQATISAKIQRFSGLSHLFLAQLAINTGFATLIGLGLWWIGIPNAFLWGALAGILRFVPYLGAILGLVFPLVLAVSVDPGWSMVLWTLGLFLGLEQSGNRPTAATRGTFNWPIPRRCRAFGDLLGVAVGTGRTSNSNALDGHVGCVGPPHRSFQIPRNSFGR